MALQKNDLERCDSLHIITTIMMYFIVVLLVNLIWIIAIKSNEKFAETVSVASTIASIILSVLAIILSLTSESRTGAIRIKMESEMITIVKTTDEMKKLVEVMDEKIKQIDTKTSKIQKLLVNQNKIDIDTLEN